MITMPVLSLQAVPECEPGHVPAGVLAYQSAWTQMAYTIDETLPMQREHQADGSQPEEGCRAERDTAEK